MASAETDRASALGRNDWIRAGLARLSDSGVDAVRVEALARDLGVSKGSFYWHFRNRGDLLETMLERWEEAQLRAANNDRNASAASRWAHLVQNAADPERIRIEVAVRAWARKDEHVARTVATADSRKAAMIAGVLRDVGFAQPVAESWSQVALLVCLGWLDLVTRDREFQVAGRGLGELLSQVVLAASGRPPAADS